VNSQKPRVIKDFEKLMPEIQEQIKLAYPEGFHKHLIHFYNKEKKKVSALPFETEDTYYMVRMTILEAREIIEEDSDYDNEGSLKQDVREEYESKYGDMDHMTEYLSDEENENDDDD